MGMMNNGQVPPIFDNGDQNMSMYDVGQPSQTKKVAKWGSAYTWGRCVVLHDLFVGEMRWIQYVEQSKRVLNIGRKIMTTTMSSRTTHRIKSQATTMRPHSLIDGMPCKNESTFFGVHIRKWQIKNPSALGVGSHSNFATLPWSSCLFSCFICCNMTCGSFDSWAWRWHCTNKFTWGHLHCHIFGWSWTTLVNRVNLLENSKTPTRSKNKWWLKLPTIY